jgi:hypothetical protein
MIVYKAHSEEEEKSANAFQQNNTSHSMPNLIMTGANLKC